MISNRLDPLLTWLPLLVGLASPRSTGMCLWKVDEVDWGKPYAARFEVGFKPDGGGKARRLAARNCRIEGWQR